MVFSGLGAASQPPTKVSHSGAVTPYNPIWEVPGSNVGWDTGYCDMFLVVLLSPSGKSRDSTLICHDHFLLDPFQFILPSDAIHQACPTRRPLFYSAGFSVNQNFKEKIFLSNSVFQFFFS
jgi:hypothetical protein